MNGDIDRVFLGNKRFKSLDVFLFSCLSANVLHLFLCDIRIGKEFELSHGNDLGISHNIADENVKA